METIRFLDKDGIFYIEQPENYNNLYFPSASEKELKVPCHQIWVVI